MKDETFRVQDIHCEGCEAAIQKSLGRLEGVAIVDADHVSNEVRVGYDDTKVGREQLVARLADAGFPPAETGAEGS